jgi:DNA-binding LacI/PurR family transcriptional regulator
MKTEQATIKDIGKILGISTSTVSRALRGKPDVNPQTKKAVKDLAEKLNYQPNQVALSLVQKKTKTIGVIIPSFTTAFYSKAISGIQEVAHNRGYHIMICQTNENYESEKRNIEIMLSSRVDGFIASITRETENLDHYQNLIDKGIPLVMFNRTGNLDVPMVMVDDYEGAYKATKHLIETGCERIAHISGPSSLQICKNRLRGFLAAMKEGRKKVHENLVVYSDFSLQSGMECGKELLQKSNRPDGIFAVCDTAAFGAMHIIKKSGLRIPDDISVVGFTNEPMAEIVEPSLTTVSQPIYRIGQTAAKMFIDMVEEGQAYVPEARVLRTELILRESTRRP